MGDVSVGAASTGKVAKGYRLPGDMVRAIDVHAAGLGVRPCHVVEAILREHMPPRGQMPSFSIVAPCRVEVK